MNLDINLVQLGIGLLVVAVVIVGYQWGLPQLIIKLGGNKSAEKKLEKLEALTEKISATATLILDDEGDAKVGAIQVVLGKLYDKVAYILETGGDLDTYQLADWTFNELDEIGVCIGANEEALIDIALDIFIKYFYKNK